MTLSPPVAEAVREMAETMGHDVSNAEVVRRGLILLDFLLHLADHEELGVRNRETDEWERIRFAWGPVTARRRGQGNQ